jgi:hypothetical protein
MFSLNRISVLALPVLVAPLAFGQSADVSAAQTQGRTPTATFSLPTDAPFVYINGTYVTGIGTGFGGANTSEIESGFSTYGYGVQGSTVGYRIADDFVVPPGQRWTLSKLHWLTYQSGAPTAGTITGINVNIWNSLPVTGGVPIWTSAPYPMISQSFTGVYRVTNTTLTNNTRPITDVQVSLAGAPVLGPGTYWVDVQLVGSAIYSGPWAPPTVPHVPADNGRQYTTAGGWLPTSDTTSLLPQDFPFALEGDNGVGGATVYCTAKVNSLGCSPSISLTGALSATAGSGATLQTVSVIGNKNGLFFHSTVGPNAVAFHGGTLCVKPPLKRHSVQNSGGTGGTCSGVFTQDFNVYIAAGIDPALVAGAQVWVQNWSRDPAAAFGDSLSDAVTSTVGP